MLLTPLVLVAGVCSTVISPTPVGRISWAATPVYPGQSLIVHGSNLVEPATVCWTKPLPLSSPESPDTSANWSGVVPTCITAPLSATAEDASSTVVSLPKEIPPQAPIHLSIGGSEPMPLSGAAGWWFLGSARGNGTSPGGWLRVFGTGLAHGGVRGCASGLSSPLALPTAGVASLVLTPATTRTDPSTRVRSSPVIIKSDNATCYAAFFRIPNSLPCGRYKVAIINDVTQQAASLLDEVEVRPLEPWPAVRIEVAAGDSAGLVAALAKLGNGSGGVVSVGPGTTAIGPSSLIVPDGVTLQGAGSGVTTLLASSGSSQTAAISVGESAAGQSGGRGRVVDLRVTVDSAMGAVLDIASDSWGSEIVRVHVDGTSKAANLTRGNVVRSSGTGLFVTDCLFEHGGDCSNSWFGNVLAYLKGVTHTLWARNIARCRCQGYCFDSPTNLAVIESTWDSSESNDAEGSGVNSFDSSVAENVYFRDNLDIGNPIAAKKWESFTTDGPGAAWTGRVGAAVAGSSAVPLQAGGLPPFNKWQVFKPGEALVVMKGPSTGVVVRVNALNAVAPAAGTISATTKLSADIGPGGFGTIMPYRGQMVFEGNRFVNGTTFQFFGAGVDCSVVNNSFHNFSSVSPWGLWYQGGFQPTVRTQWRENTLNRSTLRTIASVNGNCTDCAYVLSTTFRGNRVADSKIPISVQDNSDLTVIEGNMYVGATPPAWPVVGKNATRVVAIGNVNVSL